MRQLYILGMLYFGLFLHTNLGKARNIAVFQAPQQVLSDQAMVTLGFAWITTTTNIIGKCYSHDPPVGPIRQQPNIRGSDHKLGGRAQYEASNDTDTH